MSPPAQALPLIAALSLVLFPVWSAAPALGLLFSTLLSLLALRSQPWVELEPADWFIILGFVAVPLTTTVGLWLHHDGLWVLDRPSRLLFAVPIFLAIRSLGASANRFAVVVAGSAMVFLFVGLLDRAHGLERAVGETSHPIVFGNTALLFSIISLFSLTVHQQFRNGARLWLAAGVLAGLVASILSGSRGGWMALPPLMGLVLLWSLEGRERPRFLLLSLLIGVLAAGFVFEQTLLNRWGSALDGLRFALQGSGPPPPELIPVVARVDMWREAWNAWTSAPWFGVGPDEFLDLLEVRARLGYMEPGRAHAHNEVLTQLAWFGVMGLAGLVGLTVGIWKGLTTDHKGIWSRTGLLVLISFILFGLTDSMFSMMNRVELYTVLLAVCAGAARHAAMAQAIERSESQDSQAGHCQA